MGKGFTFEEFLKRSYQKFSDKYKYSEFINFSSKLKVECPNHGESYQKAIIHLNSKFGCSVCASEDKKTTLKDFKEKANKIHNFKYNYDNCIYINTDNKMDILCFKHGIFKQNAHIHLKGRGCPDCADEQRSLDYSKGFNKFVEEANIIHNSKYKYFEPYINTHIPILIECPIHGYFKQMPIHHLHGHSCSKCSFSSNVSKLEQKWLDTLGVSNDVNTRQITLKIGDTFIKTDAFDKENKIIYEFYGDYWHGNPTKFDPNEINKRIKSTFGELYQKTLDREKMIIDAGYNLVTIWEADWKKQEKLNKVKK